MKDELKEIIDELAKLEKVLWAIFGAVVLAKIVEYFF
jgi:hypothetical protein